MACPSGTATIDHVAFESKLRLMSLRRLTLLSIGSTLALMACGAGDDASSSAARSGVGVDTIATAASNVQWFPGSAPMLLLPAHSADRSLVVMADSSAEEPVDGVLGASGTLIRLDGSSSTVRVSIAQGPEGCIEAALEPAPSAPWGAGFVGGSPIPLVVDSLRGMARQDSSALTRIVFGLASRVPNGAGGRFSGLPFALVDLWRVRLGDGSTAIVATTKRQINQEDSPLEERTFIVAEADSSASDGYSLMYSNRSSGPEETVEGRELLAATVFNQDGPVDLIVGHDFGGQTSYSILERTGRGRWTLRWASRRFSC